MGNKNYTEDVPHVVAPTAVRHKRYFYQMTFELELPYADDTVYLAYS